MLHGYSAWVKYCYQTRSQVFLVTTLGARTTLGWCREVQCRSEYHSVVPQGVHQSMKKHLASSCPSELDYSKITPASVSVLIKRNKRDISDTTEKCVHDKGYNTRYYRSIPKKYQRIADSFKDTLRFHTTLWLQTGTKRL